MRCPRHFHDLLFKKRKIIREWYKEKKKHLEPSMEEKTKKKKKRSKETERSGGSKCKAKPTHL